MSEASLNARLMKTLRVAGLDPQRVENTVNAGCPDIEFVGGWIESKVLRRWPKNRALIVKVPHFTPAQRAWHVRRWAHGGWSWVVLEVDGEVLVFNGPVAAHRLGCVPREWLTRLAQRTSRGVDGLGSWFKEQVA